jgi:hypothetical protein
MFDDVYVSVIKVLTELCVFFPMHWYFLPRVVLVSTTVTICLHFACRCNLQQLEMQPYSIDARKLRSSSPQWEKQTLCLLTKDSPFFKQCKVHYSNKVCISHREGRQSIHARMAWRTESLDYCSNIQEQTFVFK